MYEFAERAVKRYSKIKAKQNLFIVVKVSTVEAKTVSTSERKLSELHKFMNFSRKSFRWLRQIPSPEGETQFFSI